MAPLFVFQHGGAIWTRGAAVGDAPDPRCCSSYVELLSEIRAGRGVPHLPGDSAHASLLLRLAEDLTPQALRLLTPACLGESSGPGDALRRMFGVQRFPTTLGGPHRVTADELTCYALAGCRSREVAAALVTRHSAWRHWSFATRDRAALGFLVGRIRDPRWHIAPDRPESANALAEAMRLTPRGLTADRSASDRNRPMHEWSDASLLLRAYRGSRGRPGRGEVVDHFLEPQVGKNRLLAASRAILTFLRAVWMNSLYPAQREPWFDPEISLPPRARRAFLAHLEATRCAS